MYFDNVSEMNGLEKNSLGPRGTKRIHYILNVRKQLITGGSLTWFFPRFLELFSLANTTTTVTNNVNYHPRKPAASARSSLAVRKHDRDFLAVFIPFSEYNKAWCSSVDQLFNLDLFSDSRDHTQV